MQDVGGFCHLDHERRAPTCEIVGRADPRENAVQRSDDGAVRRHVAAHVRQQHDQGGLPHVSGFPAHVGSSDDQHATSAVQPQIVRDEGIFGKALHHGMATGLDVQARFTDKVRPSPLEHAGAFGERSDGVQLRKRRGRGLHRSEPVDELGEDLLVDLFLARQGALARAEHSVLERLQFRGNEALSGLDGLAPDVVLRYPLSVLARDFDEKALHSIETQLQAGNAGAFSLALLEFQQELVGVGGDASQLVELGIVPRRNDISVAHECGGLRGNRGSQESDHVLVLVHAVAQLMQQGRVDFREAGSQQGERAERDSQLREISRTGRTERHARKNAFHISDALQVLAQAFESSLVDQRAQPLVTAAQRGLVREWAIEPSAQLP